jgi:hypothetical protein
MRNRKIVINKYCLFRSPRRCQTTKTLSEDMADEQDGDPLDLLDRARLALQTSSGSKRKKEPFYDEPEIDSDGRLVVRLDGKRPKKEKLIERSSDGSDSDLKSIASKKSFISLVSSKANKRRKGSESGWAYTGKSILVKRLGVISRRVISWIHMHIGLLTGNCSIRGLREKLLLERACQVSFKR